MIFGEMPLSEAEGAILAHSVRHQAGMFKKGRKPMQRTGHMIIHDWHVWWTCGVGKFQMSPPVMQPGPFRVVCDLADCIGGLVSGRVSRAGVAALRGKVARQQPTARMHPMSLCANEC